MKQTHLVLSTLGGAGAANNYFELNFGAGGALLFTDPATLTIDNWSPSGGAQQPPASNITINVSGSTQLAEPSSPNGNSQNGYGPGTYGGFKADSCGIITAVYATIPGTLFTGLEITVGQLALAQFTYPGGLHPVSDNLYQYTFSSSGIDIGTPCKDGFGTITGDNIQ